MADLNRFLVIMYRIKTQTTAACLRGCKSMAKIQAKQRILCFSISFVASGLSICDKSRAMAVSVSQNGLVTVCCVIDMMTTKAIRTFFISQNLLKLLTKLRIIPHFFVFLHSILTSVDSCHNSTNYASMYELDKI